MTDSATGRVRDKPAFYFDGNHHAGEVTGSMISLYVIDYPCKTTERKTGHADTAALRCLRHPARLSRQSRSVPYHSGNPEIRARFYPYPNPDEKEGLYPADIDGDGKILLMRAGSCGRMESVAGIPAR